MTRNPDRVDVYEQTHGIHFCTTTCPIPPPLHGGQWVNWFIRGQNRQLDTCDKPIVKAA